MVVIQYRMVFLVIAFLNMMGNYLYSNMGHPFIFGTWETSYLNYSLVQMSHKAVTGFEHVNDKFFHGHVPYSFPEEDVLYSTGGHGP